MHVKDLLFDLDPRAPFNEDIDLFTASRVPVANGQAPARAKSEPTDADVLASEDSAQDPQLEFVLG